MQRHPTPGTFRYFVAGSWIVPILFIAQRRSPLLSNDLWFSDKGVKVPLADLDDLLEPLSWYQEPAQTN